MRPLLKLLSISFVASSSGIGAMARKSRLSIKLMTSRLLPFL